jgi:small-conductance mechanosensitive channel
MITGILVAVEVVGIDLRALFAAGAVFAVGIGFAMQNIVQNFVSGLILLVERSIKPGDILRVDGQIVQVQAMGIRATIVRTRDEEEMIVPNSSLVQSTVTNFTMRDSLVRLRVTVGVSYGSDMAKVRGILEEVGDRLAWRSSETPRVFLAAFGSSSVDFELAVWSNDPWMSRVHMSEMREAIWFAFLEQDVTISFPQVDVHFDPPVAEGLAAMARAA